MFSCNSQGGRQQLHRDGLNKRSVRAGPYNRPGGTLPGPEAPQATPLPPPLGRHHLHVATQLKRCCHYAEQNISEYTLNYRTPSIDGTVLHI